jgi:hypothetical protein
MSNLPIPGFGSVQNRCYLAYYTKLKLAILLAKIMLVTETRSESGQTESGQVPENHRVFRTPARKYYQNITAGTFRYFT